MVNENLAVEKGLISNDDKSKYNDLVAKYKYLLEYYINTQMDLSKYDNMIKNSGLYIGINNKYKSLNLYLNFDHLFLINNLFVEKLTTEDINLLIIEFNKENISNQLLEMVSRTYRDIIRDNYFKGEYTDLVYKVCYGPAIPSNMVDNDSLVFKIYYGKNIIDLDGEKFIELHEKQLSFFEELIKKLKNDVKESLNITCDVLLEKDMY